MSEAKKFEQVSAIEGPGKYVFASNPNTAFRYYDGARYNDSLGGQRPPIEAALPEHLAKLHPELETLSLVGSYETVEGLAPALVRSLPGWHLRSEGIYAPGGYVVIGEEASHVAYGGSYSNASGNWAMEVRDCGIPRVEKEGHLHYPIIRKRNGFARVHMDGSAYHITRYTGDYWRAGIQIRGNKPGTLVRETIEWLNALKNEQNIPLWKQLVTEQEAA